MKETRFENVLKLYNKKYEFRFCRQDEYDRLIHFLDCFWKKNHVLVKSKKLLNWQYLDKDKEQYNFIFAIERKTNDIHGILGFIKTDLFDKDIKTPMRWGAIWKVREDVANMGLGLAMKLFLYQNVKAPYAGGIGLSKYSQKINQKMGEEMGILNHYYMVNQKINNFILADKVSQEDKILLGVDNDTISFRNCDKKEFETTNKAYLKYLLPYKSKQYYIKRFFEHPFYKYHYIEVIDKNENSNGAFFYRICEHNNAKCIMIVDFLGDESCLIGAETHFQNILQQHSAEYLSFYEYGLNDEVMKKSGLKIIKESEIILPLFYEPFERKNVDIDFHYFNDESVEKKCVFFKGDADQDRPNVL